MNPPEMTTMDHANRRDILGRITAMLAAPFLLGRQALDLAARAGKETPPEAPPSERLSVRLAITPPSHSVKRRG